MIRASLRKTARRTVSSRRPLLQLCDLESRDVPATFTVTNTADSGSGSLRAAITSANNALGADTIAFAPLFNTPQTISLASTLTVTGSVTVAGPSSDLLTVRGNGTIRVFNIDTALPGSNTIALRGMTIANGSASTSGGAIRVNGEKFLGTDLTVTGSKSAQLGGGLYGSSGSDLTLVNCDLSGNAASAGGAIYLDDNGNLALSSTRVNGNTATGSGGGLYADTGAELTIDRSRITSNIAGQRGGGFFATEADVHVSESLIAHNTAALSGGGGEADSFLGVKSYEFSNVTVSGNRTTANGSQGGGLEFSTDLLDRIDIDNSTITDNRTGPNGTGGGISTGLTSALFLESTIVSGNSATFAPDVDTLVAANVSHSAVDNLSGLLYIDSGNNYFGYSPEDLRMGPLQDNGGATETHALASDSPVLDKGSNPRNLTHDSRGGDYSRAIGGSDIGSYERQASLIVLNANDSGPGSLRQALADADALDGVETITFSPTVFVSPQTIALASPIAITDGVMIQGPGAGFVTLSNSTGRVLTLNEHGNVNGRHDSTISGLTFANSGGTINGGAILAAYGNYTITDCVFTNNTGNGGALYATNAAVSIDRSTFFANTAGSGQSGGAVNVDGNLTVTNTTLENNHAGDRGGAIFVGTTGVAGLAAVTVSNSTLSGNSAALEGGGLATNFLGGEIAIRSSTIANNTANVGGGLALGSSGTTAFKIEGSIVSGNAAIATGLDIASAGTVSSFKSAVGSPGGFAPTDLGGNLPYFSYLKLSAIGNHGGPTRTHVPLPGSPLINVGVNVDGSTTDQRGFTRTVGSQPDIGSVEVQAAATVAHVAVDSDSGQRSKIRSLTVTFSSGVTIGSGAISLTRTGPAGTSPVTISVDLTASTPVSTVAKITWAGDVDNTQFSSLKDGRYQLAINSALVTDTFGVLLDGNGDGTAGDDFNQTFRRFFGDVNGDGTVDATDFAVFGNSFGSTTGVSPNFVEVVDFAGDGTIDGSDFAEFGQRFGYTI